MYTSYPSPWEAEAGAILIQDHSGLQSKFQERVGAR